jgi:predicted secreted protein
MTRAIRTVPSRKLLLTLAGALVVAAVTSVAAVGHFSSTGSGTGSASTGTLAAPTITSATPGAGTVALTWSTVALPTGSDPVTYYVTRDGGDADGDCPTAASPTDDASCTDSGLTAGTYDYTVTAVWHSWTATSTTRTVHLSSGALDHFTIGPPGGTQTAGAPFTATVTAKDAADKTVTSYAGAIEFTSNDGHADLPSEYTFVTGDNGSHTFTNAVTLKTAGTGKAVQVADGGATGTATYTVDPAAAATLDVSGYPSTTVAGVSGSFTVTAKDAYGNTATGYLGTARFSASNDGAAVLPGDYTFVSGDAGTKSLSATFKTVAGGTKALTATDTVTASITGSQAGITVTPASASSFTVTGYPSSTVAGGSGSFSVTAKDAFGNTDTNYAGIVHFTAANDAQAVLPADSTLTSGSGIFDATFKTVAGGTKTLTATDTVFSSITGSESGMTVTPATAATFTVAGYPSSTVAGVSRSFSVTAKDAFGNTDTNYAGSVHFTAANDAAAVLPADSTLSSGTGTFSATFKTVAGGTKTLTATDTVTVSITGSQSGITVTPASAATLSVSGYPTSTVAGVSHSFAVTALDAFANTDTNYAGTVHFTATNDAQAALPANSTLSSGMGTFSATFKTVAGGTKTLTATDTVTSSITGSQSSITVTPATAASFTVSGYPASTVAGTSNSFTVTAKDPFGNTDANYAGTAHFTATNDAQAVLPSDLTLTSGTGTFSATFKTGAGGTKTLTATDRVTSSITGSQTGIAVSPATASTLVFSTQPGSATAGAVFGQQPIVKAQDNFGNNSTVGLGTSRNVTVAIASGAGALQGTATLDIGTAAGNGTATFTNLRSDTAGAKTLSATAALGSPTLSVATSTTFTVSAATASTLVFSTQPGSATAGSAFGTQPVVKTQDSFGNDSTVGLGASRNVTVAIASGTGTVQGTATLDIGTAAGNGTIIYTNLRIDAAGAKTLSATAAAGSPTLAAANSNSFTVSPAAAAGIVLSGITTNTTPAINCTGSVGSITCSSTGEANSSGNVLVASFTLVDQFQNPVTNAGAAVGIDLSAAGQGSVTPSGSNARSIPNGQAQTSATFNATRSTGNGKTLTVTATVHGTSQTVTITMSS